MNSVLALDTSVAVPLLLSSHSAHATVSKWWAGRPVALCGHALIETYSVLTRLPGDARLGGTDAARLIDARFERPLTLTQDTFERLSEALAEIDVVGGAVYDALVALAALDHDAVLATRDERARTTYDQVGVRVETVV